MGRTKVRKPRDILKRRRASEIVPRTMWGAQDPVSEEPLQLPVYNVMIKFYTDSPPCTNKEDCIVSMQMLQKRSIEQGLPDIPYNFLIGGDDKIYEGRGWFAKPSKVDGDMPEWDGTSLDIAYIGMKTAISEMTLGLGDLLRVGIFKKCIVSMFKFEILDGIEDFPPPLKLPG